MNDKILSHVSGTCTVTSGGMIIDNCRLQRQDNKVSRDHITLCGSYAIPRYRLTKAVGAGRIVDVRTGSSFIITP